MQGEELQALLLRSQAGDLEAFSRIVEYFQKPLSRYLLHIVGDTALAEDLTQDTFIELFESLERVEAGQIRQVQAWLYRAATNNALSALRRRRRFSWLPLSWFHGRAADGASVESQVVERDLVRRALTTLPVHHATCLLLHDGAGLTCSEVAELQGIRLEAAKQRLARARRGFIAAYKGSLHEGERANPQPGPYAVDHRLEP
jgi:RNA polymerase sigma-70 factor (ECF subfamily)